MKIDRSLLPFKALYFFIYAAMAALMPFLTLYYERLGLSGKQIGILAAIPPLITFLSAPLFGFIADLTQRPRLLLGISVSSVALGIYSLTVVDSFPGLILVVIFYAFFFAPILPIVDRSTLSVLGVRKDQYGKQRLWGAIGWGLIAPVAGLLVDRGGMNWTFYASAATFMSLLFLIRFIPVNTVLGRESFWKGFKQLFGNWPVIVFFVVALGGGIGLAMIHHYLFLYLDGLGASSITMGWALSLATISELIVMYYSDRLLRWWGASGLLLFALGSLAVRLLAMAFAASPEWVLLLQLLHGPTFAGLWMAGVAYVSEIAPPGLETTSQGMLTGFVMGLGSTIGALLGGILFDEVGLSMMYLGAGLAMLVLTFVFFVVNKRKH